VVKWSHQRVVKWSPIAASVETRLSQLPALITEQLGSSENAPKLLGEDRYCTVKLSVTPLLSRTTTWKFFSVQACLISYVVRFVAVVPMWRGIQAVAVGLNEFRRSVRRKVGRPRVGPAAVRARRAGRTCRTGGTGRADGTGIPR
jgi:hypothetical protein